MFPSVRKQHDTDVINFPYFHPIFILAHQTQRLLVFLTKIRSPKIKKQVLLSLYTKKRGNTFIIKLQIICP